MPLFLGAQLNREKSKALQFGLFSTASVNIPFVSTVSVLGVPFSRDGIAPQAWEEVYAQAESQVQLASQFELSFRDKAFLIKTVISAKLWFAARVALPPPGLVRRMTSLVFSFFWNERTELVARPAMRLSDTN